MTLDKATLEAAADAVRRLAWKPGRFASEARLLTNAANEILALDDDSPDEPPAAA